MPSKDIRAHDFRQIRAYALIAACILSARGGIEVNTYDIYEKAKEFERWIGNMQIVEVSPKDKI